MSKAETLNDGWDRGWEEHKRRQRIRMSKLTLAQKIQWLEDMQIIYGKLAAARNQSGKRTESIPLQQEFEPP